MKRIILLPLISLALQTFALNAFAQPTQVDVIGLVPGVSDEAKVESLTVSAEEPFSQIPEFKFFEIGGFKIPCQVEFDSNNRKLESLICFTGEYSGIMMTEASNAKIHRVLVKGFTKKFGKPTSITDVPVRTKNGVAYTNQIVIWKDKKNNELGIFRMSDTIDGGFFHIKSGSLLKRENREEQASKSREKF